MGERLAKEIEAIYRAKFEQIPTWHEATAVGGSGDMTDHEVIRLLLGTIGSLWQALMYLAREMEDPPVGGHGQ